MCVFWKWGHWSLKTQVIEKWDLTEVKVVKALNPDKRAPPRPQASFLLYPRDLIRDTSSIERAENRSGAGTALLAFLFTCRQILVRLSQKWNI